MEHVELWLKFLLSAAIVFAAGLSLTRNAERLAGALGWGHAFAGFVVLGWATSLPELTISLSAVIQVDSPGLSAGNITGSVIFNLAILAVLFLLVDRTGRPVRFSTAGLTSLAVFDLVMLGGMLLVGLRPALGRGSFSRAGAFLMLGLYVAATLWSWSRQRGGDPEPGEGAAEPLTGPGPEDAPRAAGSGAGVLGLRCLVAGLVILLAGVWLTRLGDAMARTYDLTEGFVGTLFLGAVSSLPELVTGLAAVRLGLLSLCVGSILGSNIFNLGILGACDLIHQARGEHGVALLLSADDPELVENLAVGMALTLLALLVVRLRGAGAPRVVLQAASLAMLLFYVLAVAPV